MKFFVCTVEDPELMSDPEYAFEIIEAKSGTSAALIFAESHKLRGITGLFVSVYDPKRVEIKRNETVTYEAVERGENSR